jgi:putative transposase
MPQYRRAVVPGGTFFFTVTLLERHRKLLTEHIDHLRAAFLAARQRRPFTVEAIVILPDHLHCIWTLPPEDADFSTRWHDIKARFAAQIPPGESLSARRLKKGERGIWQRRFWEHVIRDEGDYARHVDYIHYNPVKHGHAARVADWPYSSFHRYVQRGVYDLDWAAADDVQRLDME